MDCEKYDLCLMDALYEELDEVTRAAMKRHAESCARCSSVETGLRATMEVGVLPLEEPSDGLEERILAAAEAAQRGAPWHSKLMHTLSWAGSHAMRPQLAMAALLVLVLGSSILLLRARPGSVAVTPVKVTERGTPNPDTAPEAEGSKLAAGESAADQAEDLGAEEQARARASALANAEAGQPREPTAIAGAEQQPTQAQGEGGGPDAEQFDRALANYRAGRHREAQADFGAINQRGGGRAPSAALYEARSVRWHSGCRSAVSYYGTVRQRFGGSPAAADAAWEQADCHRILGELDQARKLWQQLAANDAYRSRAVNELSARGQVATAGKPVAGQARSKKAAPPPAPTSAKQNADQKGGTSGSNAKAAPKPKPAPQQDFSNAL